MRPVRPAPFHACLIASYLVPLAGAAVHAQTLDIKPGLWEITSSNHPGSVQSCYPEDKIKAGFSPIGRIDPKLECRHEWSQGTNKVIVTRSTCGGPYRMTGEARAEVNSPESITVTARQDVDMDGERASYQITTRYRWIGTDCGAASGTGK